jgi:Enoyl-(Acyl carrier protein) reductase
VYTATKGAVDAITGMLANELGPRKIRVNTVSPTLTETEGTHSAGMLASEFEAGIIAQTPLGRLGQPQDIADVVAFVASDDALGDRRKDLGWCRPALMGKLYVGLRSSDGRQSPPKRVLSYQQAFGSRSASPCRRSPNDLLRLVSFWPITSIHGDGALGCCWSGADMNR